MKFLNIPSNDVLYRGVSNNRRVSNTKANHILNPTGNGISFTSKVNGGKASDVRKRPGYAGSKIMAISGQHCNMPPLTCNGKTYLFRWANFDEKDPAHVVLVIVTKDDPTTVLTKSSGLIPLEAIDHIRKLIFPYMTEELPWE